MIPKIIHYCWVGEDPLPELAIKCIDSWKRFCPDYEIIKWNEDNYDFKKNRYMKEAYDAKKWGFVPDYARLDIVYSYGGVYLDVDVELIKPIDDLLFYPAFMGLEKPGMVALGLGFGAEKGNEMIKKMRDYYNSLSFINENGTYNTIASPRIQTAVLREYGLDRTNHFQIIDGVAIFPSDYFCPISQYTGKTIITQNTYSIHHFMASWQSYIDKLITGISVKFDKSKKIQYWAERLLTFPFRVIRKTRQKGLVGAMKIAINKVIKSEGNS